MFEIAFKVNPDSEFYKTGQFNELCAYYDYSVAPACILNPKSLNLRQSMAYVEEVSE